MSTPNPDVVGTVDGERSVDELITDLYEELRRLARSERRRGGSPQTVDTTVLLNELYLKLAQTERLRFGGPRPFFAYAAQSMRYILMERARHRARLRSGGGLLRISLTDPGVEAASIDPAQALELDAGLRALQREDPRAAEVVDLHFFAGLGLEQCAQLLGVTRRTVDRDWQFARAFLLARMA